jgi:Leucine-rich repeat (LRR) protein
MKQNLLTKHCALLLLLALATAWSTPAWAAIKIHVRTTNGVAAPHLYVWDSDETPLNGGWPGEVMTTTTTAYDGSTWYVATFNESTVNAIINDGSNQTGNITGIDGDRYYEYQGGSTYYNLTNMYIIPSGAVYKDGKLFVYFVNTSQWGTPYAWIYKDGQNFTGGNWPGQPMTKVDGSDNLWSWETDNTGTPTKVIFSDNGSNESSAMDWVNGGYYSTNSLITTINQLQLNATYFPDANFRAALAEALNVNEGDNIYPNNVKVLDVSGKGISNLAGIANFTNLEELYASSNNITYGDLTALHRLRILDVHGNSGLKGFGVNAASTSNPILNLPPAGSNVLEYIDISSCALQYCNQAAFADRVANTLETLIIANNYDHYHFNSVPALNTLSKLKYFDMSGCDATPANVISSFSATQKSTLEYLDLSNNHMTSSGAAQTLDGFTVLETFKFGSQASWANTMTITNCPALTHIDVSGNLHMTGLTINNSGITTLNFPEATTLTGLTALTTLNVSNNPFTVLNIPQTPNTLLTVTANDCSTMTRILAEHNTSKLQYVTAHNCPALTDITINGADIYFNKQLNAFDATNKSTLVTLDLSNDFISTNYALDGFTALQTVDFDNNYMEGNNNTIHEFTATNCPALTSVNLGGITNMQTVTLTNNGFSNSSYPLVTVDAGASNVVLDFSDNNFTDVPNIQASQINVLKLNNNQLSDINIPNGCNVNYLYAQNNNFGSGAYTLPTTSLVGLDLGNNGFTKFKAENNTSLKSLALAGNTALTEIELHGNTALTQTSPDGVIESDNGLYIKGLSNLQTLNIENSSFNKFGQQNSLEGVTGLTKLQARHNEFTTFTNGVYALDVAGTGNYRKPDNTESSLEHLTALEYLDLAYNNLQDSVHLYKNVALKHLDVSHNNEIHGVIDGTITADNTAAQEAMRTKKAKRLVKYGMYYGEKGELTDALYAQACADQAGRQVRFDIRYEDLNDTTGIYHLDLQKNVNLEWIDISYTNIHNTAAGPGVMNPGWMSRDWVGDSDEALAATVHANTTTQRSYSAFHTFVYFAPCSKLKTIHMDHCNLQSLGISYFPELDTLTASYMYGDCYFMRDATKTDLRYGMANTGPGRVRKYLSPKTNTETGIQDAVNVVGPDGTASSYYDNNIKYYDISYSGFNELRFNYGINLEHVNVSGNPLKFHVHPNSDYSYYNSLDVTYCPNIRTVLAENCSDLPIVRAHNRTNLDTLYVSNDPNLKVLYVQNDPLLKTNFAGLNTLTGLETLFGYNNTQWGNDINFSSNTALKNLWISNIGTSSINVANNANLEKLRAYDNSLTTLDLSHNGELLWLDVARNKLPEIDLSGNTKLQFFNISNGSDTRTQLDGTETLNHDGSDGDATYPTTIFSADEAPIANANNGNSLSDLALPASITDARANGNDLHSITGNFANLTNIEFAHNHINGIDLSAAPGATIESRDNGRTIVADCAAFSKKVNGSVQEFKVYFFQLDPNVTGNGTVLTLKDSEDLKGDTRRLGTDGMVMNNITWDGTSGSALKNTITPGDMSALDPDDVPGNIVVLNPTSESGNGAEGTATYTYKTGENSTSEFYLNWSSDGTVTGINEIKAEDGVSITNTYGNLTVNGADGTVVGVYDTNGRQVASETIINGSVTIDGLTPGIYVVNGVKVLVK